MATRDTGPSEDYDTADEAALEAALDNAWDDYDGEEEPSGTPSRITVTAEIEWAGVKDRARGGQRTTTLDDLDLTGVRDALGPARKAKADEAKAGSSFTAKGWTAQLKFLTKDPRGHAATDRADLTVTRATLVKWLAGESRPNPANERKIHAAYQDIRNQVIRESREKAARANHEVAEALNRALEDRYGAEIRLRHITHISLHD